VSRFSHLLDLSRIFSNAHTAGKQQQSPRDCTPLAH